jgi:hypothetical protein
VGATHWYHASTQPPVQALASLDGEGCQFGWENNWLIYQFSDGRVHQSLNEACFAIQLNDFLYLHEIMRITEGP